MCVLIWVSRWSFLANFFPHVLHSKAFSPVWIFMWTCMFCFLVKFMKKILWFRSVLFCNVHFFSVLNKRQKVWKLLYICKQLRMSKYYAFEIFRIWKLVWDLLQQVYWKFYWPLFYWPLCVFHANRHGWFRLFDGYLPIVTMTWMLHASFMCCVNAKLQIFIDH